jgi:hypothetical protein
MQPERGVPGARPRGQQQDGAGNVVLALLVSMEKPIIIIQLNSIYNRDGYLDAHTPAGACMSVRC